ncbi:DUF402 domain-containing protein, partial [Glycomyces tenuis]|uniref:DUF402 domain-containing protein n=1 Tax=Glycomyces tenuis TaxID=58116 RepID=UPI00054D8843
MDEPETERADSIERVEVLRGGHKADDPGLFGPLPGVRIGDVVAYEFELPERIEPWPGRTRLERVFVLLDLGVSMSNPCWRRANNPDGTVVDNPASEAHSWYVDLITVDRRGEQYVFRDLFIDVRVPTDGRHYRMLDLDEFADAIEDGLISLEQAVSGLRRWQRFIDRHLHAGRFPSGAWTDFPPAALSLIH